MKGEEERILNFYNENKTWLEMVVENSTYPRVMRAMVGALIDYVLEKGGKRTDVNE